MTAITEQRIPWLRGERRAAGGADAVAARDQPQSPRRPLPEPLPRAKKVAVLVAAVGLTVGAVGLFLGPLADRCGPVGDVKRCSDRPSVPVRPADGQWTAAFEAVVPAPAAPVPAVAVPAVPAGTGRTRPGGGGSGRPGRSWSGGRSECSGLPVAGRGRAPCCRAFCCRAVCCRARCGREGPAAGGPAAGGPSARQGEGTGSGPRGVRGAGHPEC